MISLSQRLLDYYNEKDDVKFDKALGEVISLASLDPIIQLVKETVWQRLEQHRWNLELWQNGFLDPTEPDAEEREIVKRELKAAISELEYLSKACNL